ncbi:MAG: glycosyltransferase family 39 protein [Acidobacteria bacterium]|nr:glycosyltransferase family 39 protein [Acidobacteriota bacterium]
MPRRIPRLLWLAIPLAYVVYLFGLGDTGVLGPDEPRYASIARAMAQSGDWVTPRLWGSAWFEKPALLYWMQGAAFRLGISRDLAPRLPVALLALGFLAFYWWVLRREFGSRPAWTATLILGTSGMWIGYSQVGVTDIPLSVTYSTAMLLALPWVARGEARWLPASSALFGAAVLAKGLVPLPLAVPLLLGRPIREWLRPRAILPFFLVAGPWYALCYLRNGWPFIHEFFVVHHFSRITSGALMHVQPKWYYVPVLIGALLPWTPLVFLPASGEALRDRRGRFLLAWGLCVVVFFSIAVNKLPGYILPAMPALAAWIALRLEDARGSARWLLAACGFLTVAFPIAARLLPVALLSGLSRAGRPHFEPVWLAALAAGVLAFELDRRGRRLAAVAAIAASVGLGVLELKTAAAPAIERTVSARPLWREIAPLGGQVCLGDVKRDWDYGLAYYAGSPLPRCDAGPKPWEIVPAARDGADLRPKTP